MIIVYLNSAVFLKLSCIVEQDFFSCNFSNLPTAISIIYHLGVPFLLFIEVFQQIKGELLLRIDKIDRVINACIPEDKRSMKVVFHGMNRSGAHGFSR